MLLLQLLVLLLLPVSSSAAASFVTPPVATTSLNPPHATISTEHDEKHPDSDQPQAQPDQPVEQPVDKPADHPVDQPAEQPVDQPIERGKFLPFPVESEQAYRVYKEQQQDYHAKAFNDNDINNWKTLADRDGVQVSMLPRADDPTCPYVRLQATMPVSVENCWDFLRVSNWDVSMAKMDPFYEGVSIHDEFWYNPDANANDHGENVNTTNANVNSTVYMMLCRKRTKRFLAFGKRDFTFLTVKDQPLEDGTWVSGSVSVLTEKLPRVEGYCRAFQDSIAFYKPLKNNTETAVTIICRIDLNDSASGGAGGNIPMWLYIKSIGITGAKSMKTMRDALAQEEVERKAKQDEQPAMA